MQLKEEQELKARVSELERNHKRFKNTIIAILSSIALIGGIAAWSISLYSLYLYNSGLVSVPSPFATMLLNGVGLFIIGLPFIVIGAIGLISTMQMIN